MTRGRRKQEENRISYGWDDIISRVHTSRSPEYEIIARELARPNRFHRRCLAKLFADGLFIAHSDSKHNIRRRLIVHRDRLYLFLYMDSSAPRDFRRELLYAHILVAGSALSACRSGIGIATENKLNPTSSYDYCYIPELSADDVECARAKQIVEAAGLTGTGGTLFRIDEDEYPDP